MRDISINGYHLPTVAKLARDMGSPTHGEFAAIVWNLTVLGILPVDIAEEFAKDAGIRAIPRLSAETRRLQTRITWPISRNQSRIFWTR